VEDTPNAGDRKRTNRLEVPEGHKLDNVPEDRLPLGRAQDPVVPVQDLHVREVCVAHAHDDDGQRLVGGAHDGLARVRHVGHHAVRQDEQDVVALGDRRTTQCWSEQREREPAASGTPS